MLKKLWKNKKGAISAQAIILLAVAALMVAVMFPMGMTEIIKYNATTKPLWNAAVLTIFTLLTPILFIVGIAIKFIPRAKGAFLEKFKRDTKGAVTPVTIILLAIGFILTCIITPIILDQIAGTTTTLWNAAIKTLFTILIPILYIIGIAVRFIPTGKGD